MVANGDVEGTGSGSSGGPTGPEFISDLQDEIRKLYDLSMTPITSVGGSANAITGSFTPAEATLTAGRRFALIPTANNTGAVTLNLNSLGATAVEDDDSQPLGANQLVSGRLYILYFDGSVYRVVHSSSLSVVKDLQVFTATGTWNKPANTDDEAWVLVELWGGGGGGGTNNNSGAGGGGGGYAYHIFRAGDLASSVGVTVGAAGAVNGNGGNTVFGPHFVAYGGGAGGAGDGSTNFGLGGSGGSGVAGGTAGADAQVAGANRADTPAPDNSAGYGGGFTDPSTGRDGGNGSLGGGGGGAGAASSVGSTGTGGDGGKSFKGGGGGGGAGDSGTHGNGGTSVFGGGGGNKGAAGSAPGGGGGSGAAGARGEAHIRVLG